MGIPHSRINLADVSDAAPANGFGDRWEARVAREDLHAEQTGLTHVRLRPGKRSPFMRRHKQAEEVYVILGGDGRIKLDDEISRRPGPRCSAHRARRGAGLRGRPRGPRVHRLRPSPQRRRRGGRRPLDRRVTCARPRYGDRRRAASRSTAAAASCSSRDIRPTSTSSLKCGSFAWMGRLASSRFSNRSTTR